MTILTSRYYKSEDDLRQMQDLLMAARAATNDWRYPHIGVATFRFFMVACHLNPYEFVRPWHDPQGRLVGYALLARIPPSIARWRRNMKGSGWRLRRWTGRRRGLPRSAGALPTNGAGRS